MCTGLEQLIYTSFPGIGLKNISSTEVPPEIQDLFLKKIVYRYWNSYKPPSSDEKAIYLYQPNLENCIFGWLYTDRLDEHNRNAPFFLGYFLPEPLDVECLEKILICLQKGPLFFWEQNFISSDSLFSIDFEDVRTYEPARDGLPIPAKICDQSYASLKIDKPLDFFLFSSECLPRSSGHNNIHPVQSALIDVDTQDQTVITLRDHDASILNCMDEVSDIIEELINKPIEIKCAFLVSSDGQLLTAPVSMDENSAQIISGMMMYLAKSTSEELQWGKIEKISIQGNSGYLILAYCTPEAFLLVQTGKALMGLLDGEINRVIQKIQGIMQAEEFSLASSVEEQGIEISPQLTDAVDSVNSTNVLYRGNPVQRTS